MAERHRFGARDIRRAAELASLALTTDECLGFAEELAPVLGEFDRIEPPGLPSEVASRDRHLEPGLRSDAPDSDALHRRLSELAPDWRDGFFVVPRLPALDR